MAKSRRDGALRKADRLAGWLETTLHLYAARVLSLDIDTANELGLLFERARASGQSPGMPDLVIAATALRHRHTVLTRNVHHFRGLCIAVRDPFDSLPDNI